jgi:hypothetical protein
MSVRVVQADGWSPDHVRLGDAGSRSGRPDKSRNCAAGRRRPGWWHWARGGGRCCCRCNEGSNEDSTGNILTVPVPVNVPEGWPEPSGARDPGALAVLPALRDLLPRGGLACGSVVAVGGFGLLCLALAAGVSAAEAWCAIAGVPEAGMVAAAGLGLDPGRTLLVPDPGPARPQVTTSLLDGCELVLLRPPAQATAQVRRHLEAVLRRGRGVLLVAGDWPGAQVRLQVVTRRWTGLGDGHGRLRACRAQVRADGRGP